MDQNNIFSMCPVHEGIYKQLLYKAPMSSKRPSMSFCVQYRDIVKNTATCVQTWLPYIPVWSCVSNTESHVVQ